MPNIKKYKTKRQLRNREVVREICTSISFVATILLMFLGFWL